MTSHIKLHGGKSERFKEIKQEYTDLLGYEPSNAEVMGFLMANYRPLAEETQRSKLVGD